MIAVVDYGMGNRRSVEKALQHVGVTAVITGDHDVLRSANGVVLPGVGAFPQATKNLSAAGLDTLLCELAAAGMPLLGICLGMQLLFERSSELGGADGLGLIPGTVRPLDAAGLRVPHIGWSEVRFERSSPLTAELPATGVPFYHVHSFVAAPSERSDVIGTAEYGERFATIVARGNVFGAQFHPEKSSRDGLSLLSSFVALTRDVGALAA